MFWQYRKMDMNSAPGSTLPTNKISYEIDGIEGLHTYEEILCYIRLTVRSDRLDKFTHALSTIEAWHGRDRIIPQSAALFMDVAGIRIWLQDGTGIRVVKRIDKGFVAIRDPDLRYPLKSGLPGNGNSNKW